MFKHELHRKKNHRNNIAICLRFSQNSMKCIRIEFYFYLSYVCWLSVSACIRCTYGFGNELTINKHKLFGWWGFFPNLRYRVDSYRNYMWNYQPYARDRTILRPFFPRAFRDLWSFYFSTSPTLQTSTFPHNFKYHCKVLSKNKSTTKLYREKFQVVRFPPRTFETFVHLLTVQLGA